ITDYTLFWRDGELGSGISSTASPMGFDFKRGSRTDAEPPGHKDLLMAVCCRSALATLEIAFDGIEDAVYELRCFKGRKTTSYLQSFVNPHSLGRIGLVEELVNGEAKDVTVHNRHSLDTPMFGTALYQVINFIKAGNRAKREIIGEFTSNIAHVIAERFPVAVSQLVNARLGNVVLKEHL